MKYRPKKYSKCKLIVEINKRKLDIVSTIKVDITNRKTITQQVFDGEVTQKEPAQFILLQVESHSLNWLTTELLL